MSKTYVLKALSLLQVENKDKFEKSEVKSSSIKNKKKKKNVSHGTAIPYAPIDKTEKNLEVLKRLKQLRPKSSVAQKVIQFYTKQNNPADDDAEVKPQRSILFEDEDNEAMKKKKKRKNREADDDDDI